MSGPLLEALRKQLRLAEADGLPARAACIREVIDGIETRRAARGPVPAQEPPKAEPPPVAPAPPPRPPEAVDAELRRAGERVHAADCDCRECIP